MSILHILHSDNNGMSIYIVAQQSENKHNPNDRFKVQLEDNCLLLWVGRCLYWPGFM